MRIAIDFTIYGNFSLQQNLHRQVSTLHLQILAAGKRQLASMFDLESERSENLRFNFT